MAVLNSALLKTLPIPCPHVMVPRGRESAGLSLNEKNRLRDGETDGPDNAQKCYEKNANSF